MISNQISFTLEQLVDTHRHHGGSTPIEFIKYAISKGACELKNEEEIKQSMICYPWEHKEGMTKFELFLEKFKLLDKIKWSEDLIAENIKHVCNKLREEGIFAAFMDFSVSKYRHIGWSLPEAIQFICDRFEEYSTIRILPILSIKYESPVEAQLKIAKIIDNGSVGNRICGIDYVGDESKFNPHIQKIVCDMWKNRFVRLHVGESGPIDNIKEVLKFNSLTNIAHGIKIVKDYELMKRIADTDITFDVAPSSNYLTGVVPFNRVHPAIEMMRNGIKVTVGSDDPIQCNTILIEEIGELIAHGMETSEYYQIVERSTEMFKKWEHFSLGKINEQNTNEQNTNESTLMYNSILYSPKWISNQAHV